MTIDAFVRRLDSLSSGVQFAEFKQTVATSGLALIRRCFEDERDPYGKKWKFVKSHEGHQSILDDSGDLKNGWKAQTIAEGVRFFNNVIYANKQNYTRQMVPNSMQGLPTAWKAAISRAFTKTINTALRADL